MTGPPSFNLSSLSSPPIDFITLTAVWLGGSVGSFQGAGCSVRNLGLRRLAGSLPSQEGRRCRLHAGRNVLPARRFVSDPAAAIEPGRSGREAAGFEGRRRWPSERRRLIPQRKWRATVEMNSTGGCPVLMSTTRSFSTSRGLSSSAVRILSSPSAIKRRERARGGRVAPWRSSLPGSWWASGRSASVRPDAEPTAEFSESGPRRSATTTTTNRGD